MGKERKNSYISFPDKMKYDFNFLRAIFNITKRVLDSNSNTVYAIGSNNTQCDSICVAVSRNILGFFAKTKIVKLNPELVTLIGTNIHSLSGSEFSDIDLERVVADHRVKLYTFNNNNDVEKVVSELAGILIDSSLTINTNEVREFLSTTIGEIFSNSFVHSKQDEVFFMYDVLYEDNNFYLCVNIIDYGVTIIDNIQNFFNNNNIKDKTSRDCIDWAIREGNTTRKGSGGYGLPTLINYIKEVNGTLYIFSGDAYFRYENNITIINSDDIYLPGTSVSFSVKLFNKENIITYDSSSNKLVNSTGLNEI